MSLEEKARKLAEVEKQRAEVDWNAERDWWLGELERLYANIERWLTPLREKGLVTIERSPISLSEEKIGVYAANHLILTFGPQAIFLEPKGTLIVGARGRVDLFRRGSRSMAVMLILSGAKDAPRWDIWLTRDPHQREPLEKTAFERVIEGMLEV